MSRIRRPVAIDGLGALAVITAMVLPRRVLPYRFISISFPLTTAALSTDCVAQLEVLNGAGNKIAAYSLGPFAAGSDLQVTFISGLGYNVVGLASVAGVSLETFVVDEITLRLSFLNADVADTMGGAVLFLEEEDLSEIAKKSWQSGA